ncbi:MAG: shikimate dehydrogenase [Actinobacteria bacterium]|nr:shikimate dehydrogenase [Actinomycetota bacterium]
MPRAAVLGSPIGHSLSPVLHLAAYDALGLPDWRYQAVDCDEHRLLPFVSALDREWVGLSLTMPLKRLVLELADEVSPLAAAVGAANTLIRHADGWFADNTDVGGIVDVLRESGVSSPGSAVVVGAGGTAQAALAALRELGMVEPVVLVRDLARTAELRAAASRLDVRPQIQEGITDPAAYKADVLISTIPAGAADQLARAPQWNGHGLLLDAVYDRWPTPIAVTAAACGWRIASGLDMLLGQAVRQVTAMTGLPAPVAAMRAALYAAAAGR